MAELREDERELLEAIAWHNNAMASAQRAARKLGYRPSYNGILAVTSRCRALNRRHPGPNPDQWANRGKYLVRIPAEDQWSQAIWCVTSEGLAEIRVQRQEQIT